MSRGSGSSGSPQRFRGTEQSLHIMRQVKSYFNVGMDHVLEVAADMAEYGKGDKKQAAQLEKIMLNYLEMEREMETFMTATSDIIARVGDDGDDLERRLDERVRELSSHHGPQESLQAHEKFQELKQKIWDSQHQDAQPVPEGGASASAATAGGPLQDGGEGGEGDVEMTQEQVNTRCPYTGLEMEDPVRNVQCGHTYDRAGIQQHMKKRGKKAMCPVGGCTNNKPITSRDLQENKAMKKLIQAGRKKDHNPPCTSTSSTSLH